MKRRSFFMAGGTRKWRGDSIAELERAWLRIQEQPEIWPVVELGLRRCLFDHFPYAVIYRLTNQTAYVVTVAHLSRKPDYWFDRLQDIP